MEREFKHPQIFADMLVFCQLYYPMHNNLPKPFRFAVGERILAESAECLRAIVLANAVDKSAAAGCAEGAAHVRRLRASVEVLLGHPSRLRFGPLAGARPGGGRLVALDTPMPKNRPLIERATARFLAPVDALPYPKP